MYSASLDCCRYGEMLGATCPQEAGAGSPGLILRSPARTMMRSLKKIHLVLMRTLCQTIASVSWMFTLPSYQSCETSCALSIIVR